VLLDRYIREQAGQDLKRLFAGVFVAVDRDDARRLAGFYTLSAFAIDISSFPAAAAKKLPRYPLVPAFLLGRLAVDRAHQGKGLGAHLLSDALRRCSKQASHEVAAPFVVVDAIDANADAFYRRFGFENFPEPINHLYLSVKSIPAPRESEP
jgi:GNAT superfamily N-acetyltransferase